MATPTSTAMRHKRNATCTTGLCGEDSIDSHEPMGMTSVDNVRHAEESVDQGEGNELGKLGSRVLQPRLA